MQLHLGAFLHAALPLILLVQANPNKAVAQAPLQTERRDAASSMDVSVSVFGQLTQARTPTTSQQYSNGLFTTQKSQSASPSAGVVGTFHQQFTRLLGYNANVGHTRFTENYSYGTTSTPSPSASIGASSSFMRGSIGTNMIETTVAMVAQGPRSRHFTTFAQFGGGGLFFIPFTHSDAYNKQVRPTMVFGIGMNYRLSDHLGIRAEYRGLFYKSPDFAPNLNLVPVTRLFTVTNQPVFGLTYTFGGRRPTWMAHLRK